MPRRVASDSAENTRSRGSGRWLTIWFSINRRARRVNSTVAKYTR